MFFQKLNKIFFSFALIAGCLIVLAPSAAGQSPDQDLPTPVHAFEINGTIPALDIGDSRLTRHYYAFNATHGDLLVTVESRNLSGDVDVFTAVNFKPLMKIPMYSQTSSSLITKSIYIRAEDILILRIEARSPNDDAGLYRIRFGGAFAPFSGGIPVAENENTDEEKSETSANRPGTRRVSSVGARMPEPPVTIAPEPAPVVEEKKAEEKKTEETASSKPPKSRSGSRTPAKPRPPARKTKTEKAAKTENAKTSDSDEVPAPKPAVSSETETKSDTPPAETEKPTPSKQEPVVVQPGARLIILQTDGTRIDRPMSTVRRVTIENGMIVVVLKNGKTDRISLTDVARMSVEP